METGIAERQQNIAPLVLLLILVFGIVGWWGFAFANLPETTPEWVRRAQSVCFGADELGLPNAGGWLMLTVAPLSLIASLFVVFKNEIVDSGTALLKHTLYQAFSILVIVLLLAQGVWAYSVVKKRLQLKELPTLVETPFSQDYPQTDKPLPPFSLIDQHGATINERSFIGKKVIVSFLYAHCTTVCPVVLNSIKRAIDNTDAESTVVLVVTLDPWRDTPSSLPTMAKEWGLGRNSHILSGEVEVVNQVIGSFNVPITRDQKNGEVTHPAIVYIVGTNGEIKYTLNNPTSNWIEEALRRIS